MTTPIALIFKSFASIVYTPVKKVKRSRLRRMMRGYRSLKKSGRLEIVEDSIQSLRVLPLSINKHLFSKTIWGNAYDSAELVIRQRLSSNYIRLHESLLIASSTRNGVVVAPIPKIWQNQLETFGFGIDKIRCQYLWHLEVLRHLLLGIGTSFYFLIFSFPLRRLRTIRPSSHIFFCDLSASNLPIVGSDFKSSCITNWFIDQNKGYLQSGHIKHSVSGFPDPEPYDSFLQYQKHPISNDLSTSQWILYLILLIKHFFSIVKSTLMGRWWDILIYKESITSLRARLLSPAMLAKEYWFHNSRFYPPLWTYELQSKNSQSVYYFYGININPLPRLDGSIPFNTPYSIMNWSKYLLWDKSHEEFLNRCVPHQLSSHIAGPIPFSDVKEDIVYPVGINIAVFDVSPVRTSFYQKLALNYDLYTPVVVEGFLRQIVEVASKFNCNLLIKSKRNIGKLSHPRYQALLKELELESCIHCISPGISPLRLVRGVDMVISFPFTSTAHIAHACGIPSVFFCPASGLANGLPLKSPDASIELLTDQETLFQWVHHQVEWIHLRS